MHQAVEPRILEVRFMRLGCGDDIITWCMRLHEDLDGVDGWFLTDTVVILTEHDPETEKQICMMMPWLPRGIVDNADVIIEKDEVILVKKVEPTVEQYYKQLCKEMTQNKPKIFSTKNKESGRNAFGFDMSKIRPVRAIHNEQKEEKANT